MQQKTSLAAMPKFIILKEYGIAVDIYARTVYNSILQQTKKLERHKLLMSSKDSY